jgi:hypothetical protein
MTRNNARVLVGDGHQRLLVANACVQRQVSSSGRNTGKHRGRAVVAMNGVLGGAERAPQPAARFKR